MRSVSFTRSSSASLTVVVPSAMAAATARTGTSSISRGRISPLISMPRSWLDVTTMSATGSPATSLTFSRAMFAPIEPRASSTPERVGLIPTSVMQSSASGCTAAATIQNAAELMSPGTWTSAADRGPGEMDIDRPSTSI